MKKAIIVLLVAVVAMTAAFANTSDKDGFAIKADAIGLYGSYGVAYNMGDFRFGIEYMTQAPVYGVVGIVDIIASGDPIAPVMLFELFFYPFGGVVSAQYKFIATEQHELAAGLKLGYSFGGFSALVNVEYDFCFNQNHAIYIKSDVLVFPFFPVYAMYCSDIGYRYTF